MIKMTEREATDDDYRALRVPNYIQKNIAKKMYFQLMDITMFILIEDLYLKDIK